MSHSESRTLALDALLTPGDSMKMDTHRSVSLECAMENAGLMVARTIRQHFTPRRVLVACGPGNNGGDGYVAARYLQEWGWPVVVAPWKQPKAGTLVARAAEQWTGLRVPFDEGEARRAELVVDAVFGAGLSRALPKEVIRFFQYAASCVAIDVPSGVDGARGECSDDVTSAALTVALVRKRPAHLLSPAAEKCGKVICVDIGMPKEACLSVAVRYWENTPYRWSLPRQCHQDHKYTRGVVSVCGGGQMPGAALLSCESARRAGAGLVCMSVAKEDLDLYRAALPGGVIDTAPLLQCVADPRRRVWVCGPGLVPHEVEEIFPILMKEKRHIIADAGALSWASGKPDVLRNVYVMTPHLAEFERVFGVIVSSRVEAVQKAAAETGSVVVLKGADTIIAAPDGRTAINRHATPALATAGSGDVLAGIIAALCASGMTAWDASCAGVWLHGDAGLQAAAQKGDWIIAEDVFSFIGKARQAAEMACGEGENAPKNDKNTLKSEK